MDIIELLSVAGEKAASDLHLNVGSEPILRIDGKLKKLTEFKTFSNIEAMEVLEKITDEEQRKAFFQNKDLDFSYTVNSKIRNRVNVCYQQGNISFAFRLLPYIVSPLETLGLPAILGDLCLRPRGLILVTGPTGTGKTTTLASMIKHINQNQERHIITIEDPVEYVHENIKSLIIQRDVGEDTNSFSEALRGALRHNPDVLVVGEMRDLPTMATALSAAETGHLVLATLHTPNASETINRIVDAFPHEQQQQIIIQLSQVLVAVFSQTLVPLIKGGRIPACEVMVANTAIKNMIRHRQIHMLHGTIEMSRKDGMQTLNNDLCRLVKEGLVNLEDAIAKSDAPDRLIESINHANLQATI